MRLLANKIIHTASLGTCLVILAHLLSCASTQIDPQKMSEMSPDDENSALFDDSLPAVKPAFQAISKKSQTYPQQSPQFYCLPVSTRNHFTRVSINGKSLNLIHWKNTPKPRSTCDRVSKKFQDFYNAGKLNYIKGGRSKKTGNSIICGTAEDIECNEKSKLFDLPPYAKPASSLADDLKQRLKGYDSSLADDLKRILRGEGDENNHVLHAPHPPNKPSSTSEEKPTIEDYDTKPRSPETANRPIVGGFDAKPNRPSSSAIYQGSDDELRIDFKKVLAELRNPNK
jgi:hypothetical protein